ncbi:MAG: hypothetical protein Fur0037_15500 [Planctomycetota bacterium]
MIALLLSWVLILFGGERERGVELLAAGRFREAVAAFQKAIEEEGDSPELQYDLALAAWRAGDAALAEKAAERIAALAPDGSPELHFGMMGILRHEEAASLLEKNRVAAGAGSSDPSSLPQRIAGLEKARERVIASRDYFAQAAASRAAGPEIARNLERTLGLWKRIEEELEKAKRQLEEEQKKSRAGQAQDGQAKDGQAQDGQAQDGQAQDGQAQDGQAKDGQGSPQPGRQGPQDPEHRNGQTPQPGLGDGSGEDPSGRPGAEAEMERGEEELDLAKALENLADRLEGDPEQRDEFRERLRQGMEAAQRARNHFDRADQAPDAPPEAERKSAEAESLRERLQDRLQEAGDSESARRTEPRDRAERKLGQARAEREVASKERDPEAAKSSLERAAEKAEKALSAAEDADPAERERLRKEAKDLAEDLRRRIEAADRDLAKTGGERGKEGAARPEPVEPGNEETAGDKAAVRHDAPGEADDGGALTPEQRQRLLERLGRLDEMLKDYRARARKPARRGGKDW